MTVAMHTDQQMRQFGVVQLLVLAAMVVGGVVGFNVGHRFGGWQALVGTIVGGVLSIPALGIVLGVVFLFIVLFERVFLRRRR